MRTMATQLGGPKVLTSLPPEAKPQTMQRSCKHNPSWLLHAIVLLAHRDRSHIQILISSNCFLNWTMEEGRRRMNECDTQQRVQENLVGRTDTSCCIRCPYININTSQLIVKSFSSLQSILILLAIHHLWVIPKPR